MNLVFRSGHVSLSVSDSSEEDHASVASVRLIEGWEVNSSSRVRQEWYNMHMNLISTTMLHAKKIMDRPPPPNQDSLHEWSLRGSYARPVQPWPELSLGVGEVSKLPAIALLHATFN